MKHKILPIRRNRNWELMLAGMATITISHSMSAPKLPKLKSDADALRGDWVAIGRDIRGAMNVIDREIEVDTD
jgi:hypothetical protein